MSITVNYGNGLLTEIQMQLDEVAFMEKTIKELHENASMVEWGSGGSTIKWLETLKPTQKLVSIEHNEIWYNKTRKAVKLHFGEMPKNFLYLHVPEKYGYDHGYASIDEEHPFGLEDYINPKVTNFWSADLYFVDGVARGACALAAFLKTHLLTRVFIHDYVGREHWYAWATSFAHPEVVGTTLVEMKREIPSNE